MSVAQAHCNNSVLWVVLIMCDCNNMMVLTSPRHNNITLDTLSSGHLITDVQGGNEKIHFELVFLVLDLSLFFWDFIHTSELLMAHLNSRISEYMIAYILCSIYCLWCVGASSPVPSNNICLDNNVAALLQNHKPAIPLPGASIYMKSWSCKYNGGTGRRKY